MTKTVNSKSSNGELVEALLEAAREPGTLDRFEGLAPLQSGRHATGGRTGEAAVTNLHVDLFCQESGGYPVYRNGRHIATFVNDADAREYIQLASVAVEPDCNETEGLNERTSS